MRLLKLLPLTCLTATVSLTAVADWTLIDDFETKRGIEDYNIRLKFDGQGDILIDQFDPQDPDNWVYFADPGPSRDVGGNNQIWNSMTLPEPVPADGKATLKYRMYFFESGPFNVNLGLSDTPVEIDESLPPEEGQMLAPNDYSDFESQVGWTDKGIITVRNGNGFSDTVVPIPVGEWTTLYYLIDNELDRTQLFYQGESMDEPELVELVDGSTDFIFRNGTTDPLVTFTVISAGSNSGPVSVFLLDDIYYDPTGFNLDGAELPEGPASWAGYPVINEAGDADTGDWLGWVSALSDPWIFVYSVGNFFYMPEEEVTDSGAWTYIPYQDLPWEEWEIGADGLVNTENFLNWLFVPGGDWVFSYTLERWIYLPQPAAGAAGVWSYVPEKPEPLVNADYPLVALTETPLIDGILSDGEWDEADMYEHSYEALIPTGIGTSKLDNDAGSPQPEAPRASADVYVGATKQGLYMGFNVIDDELTTVHEFATAGNNSDGVQVGIDVNPDPSNRDSTVLFDINPTSLVDGEPTGPVNVYARWATEGYDVTWGVKAASTIVDDGYTVEVMIPWAFANSFGIENPFEIGSNFRLTTILVDPDAGIDGDSLEILWDSGAGTLGIGNAATWPTAAMAEERVKAPITYSVPMVSTEPTVDGSIGTDEYRMAEYTEASYDNWVANAGGNSREADPDATRSEGDIYLMATDEALYMAADIVAPTISITNTFGTASNNESGVQMAVSMDPDPTTRDDASVLWDFTPVTVEGGELTGPANIFGRWGISPGYDADWGVEAAGSLTDDGYIIEVKLPWDVMRDSVNVPTANPLEKGDTFSLSFIVVNVLEDGTVNELLVDFGDGEMTIGNAATWNKAVIRND
ncbi:MAG: hypothetical protein R6V45_10290 [Oceanipulchritudo sp.]